MTTTDSSSSQIPTGMHAVKSHNSPVTTPRYKLVDRNAPMFYHLVSRCVRGSWLCGFDALSGQDYTHRKQWIVDRLELLGTAFAVDIYAFAIMSNFTHKEHFLSHG